MYKYFENIDGDWILMLSFIIMVNKGLLCFLSVSLFFLRIS